MGVSKHYSLEFGLILDAVSIGVYTYHYQHTAEVVDTAGRSWVSSDASLVDWALENRFRGTPEESAAGKFQYNVSITVSNIPAKAYEHIINGKSAIE